MIIRIIEKKEEAEKKIFTITKNQAEMNQKEIQEIKEGLVTKMKVKLIIQKETIKIEEEDKKVIQVKVLHLVVQVVPVNRDDIFK